MVFHITFLTAVIHPRSVDEILGVLLESLLLSDGLELLLDLLFAGD